MYVQSGTCRIRCFSHSFLSLFYLLPRPVQLQPLKLQCITRMVRPQRKQYPHSVLTCYTHAARWCGDGGISRHSRTYGHAREHVNGTCHRWFFESHLSTKAARLFPFYSGRLSSSSLFLSFSLSLQSFLAQTYIYLHTFLSMTKSRPPTTRELELLDPAWCVQTNRRCRSG